ncbi:LCP family protein [Streptomyces sp. NPDC047097]|uniref:LCP family protein n=1 Tax=Streptomyces sp. NPDC047097 TaxID=3155260 RepID=UPI003410860C
MNDQHNPYGGHDPYDPAGQPRIVGYDAYGQPVYEQQYQQYQEYQQDQTAQQYQQPDQSQQQWQQGASYGSYDSYDSYDPYATGQAPEQDYSHGAPDPSAYTGPQGYGQGYGEQYPQPYGGGYGQQGQAAPEAGAAGYTAATGSWAPAAAPAAEQPPVPEPRTAPEAATGDPAGREATGRRLPGQRRADGDDAGGPASAPAPDGEDYRTEQFSFVEEPDEDSQDVIDWLKFTESRSERREEAKRRGRNRVVVLAVVLAVALVAGVGWLWAAGRLPWIGGEAGTGTGAAASGPQQRDVIVLHLHSTGGDETSTALLVNNATTKRGTTVLLPNSLSVADEDGSTTTLAKSVAEDGGTGTREAVGTLLGTRITGTWRLDTPYLENLVEILGGIEVDTDTEVPAATGKNGAPRVPQGEGQTLNGRMAVAYATHRAEGEPEAKQLQRFGQVVLGTLRKISDDPGSATLTVQTLAQVLDPSLPEKDLGASLARLAEHAKVGDHDTALLPVRADGTLSEQSARSVVKDVLGGSVSAPEAGAAVRVAVRNASGDPGAAEEARIVLVNGGYTVVAGGSEGSEATSEVRYAQPADRTVAEEVAKTLKLPASAVTQDSGGTGSGVSVVLGADYRGGTG